MKEPTIKMAMNVIDFLKLDEQAMRIYEMREKALHDEISMINGARNEGILEVATKLLAKGMEIPFIVETTGLDEEEIINLKNTLNWLIANNHTPFNKTLRRLYKSAWTINSANNGFGGDKICRHKTTK